MKLTDLHIRFFKAFNFDYLRKYHGKAEALPWEYTDDDSWYPFVTVPLENGITTVVGANESGKSQVLDAIEIALTGHGARRTDFCRYSRFFIVDKVLRNPDFGASFSDLSDAEAAEVAKACGRKADDPPTAFTLIRGGGGKNTIYVREGDGWTDHQLNASGLKRIDAILPRPFRLDPNIPLPNVIPLSYLSKAGDAGDPVSAASSRASRKNLVARLAALPSTTVGSAEAVTGNAAAVAQAFAALPEDGPPASDEELRLADDLLVNIAGIGRDHFADLVETIGEGKDGYVDGVEELINRALATRLNFRKWWSQDSNFQLRVTIRESDIAFIVRDRTGTHYSFGERSGGLGYFLSYFVQYLSHRPSEGRSEVLLMDEPDAFLSSQGQKDLLKIFDAFADPDDDSPGCQVVYVTHSPFLVDKNHAERIRVIEKGEGDEGTRVVGDVARNHYEPLRSAFGALVGETTFMGNCNLMVEGIGDQILLAGLSRRLQRQGLPKIDYLDLNEITLVPSGGASHIPYLVYLARGRDIEKPAVIVLLDGDQPGSDARAAIRKGGAYKRRLLEDNLVLQLTDERLTVASDRATGPVAIEDLIPIEIAVKAAAAYAREFVGVETSQLSLDPSKATLDDGVMGGALLLLNASLDDPIKMEKVGFARAVLDQLAIFDQDSAHLSADAVKQMEANFRALFRVLCEMQRSAMREHSTVKLADRIARIRNAFLDDHPSAALRVDVLVLFEEIGFALDSSAEAEDVRSELRRLTRIHDLEIDSGSDVENPDSLRSDLAALQYLGRQQSQESASATNEVDVALAPDATGAGV